MTPVLSLHALSKSFQPGVPVLQDLSLQVAFAQRHERITRYAVASPRRF